MKKIADQGSSKTAHIEDAYVLTARNRFFKRYATLLGLLGLEFVDRLGLRGRELRVLLAQFGPEAGFMDLRFKHEAQMAFLRFMRLASQCVVVVHPCAQQACG